MYISLLARSRGKTFLCVKSWWSRDLYESDSSSFHSVDVQFVQTRYFPSLSSDIFTRPIKELGLFPANSPNAAHMHRDVEYYTSQASLYSSHLLLLVGYCHAWGATNGSSSLYGCVGHWYVTEVVLADCLDGVCVCRKVISRPLGCMVQCGSHLQTAPTKPRRTNPVPMFLTRYG